MACLPYGAVKQASQQTRFDTVTAVSVRASTAKLGCAAAVLRVHAVGFGRGVGDSLPELAGY
jgi:hypothetical protein